MGFRFFKRIKLLPGVHLNLTKRGASVSAGPRGAKVTVGTSGVRGTVGIPGTGLYYTTKLNKKKRTSKERKGKQRVDAPPTARADQLSMGFFRRLITPAEEEHLVDGCRALIQGNHREALKFFRQGAELPDCAFLAGMLSLDAGNYEDARGYLNTALESASQLGKRIAKWDAAMTVSLAITPEITAHLAPSKPGALLALIELDQELGDLDAALQHSVALARVLPDDPLARLSQAELLWEQGGWQSKARARRILNLAKDVANASALHGALLLYRARALRALGLTEESRDQLTALLRRKKERPPDLLQAARFERALVYEALGQGAKARKEFAKVYAEDPEFPGVAKRVEG
jgi:tetratricopeptide (TPR) repeat protein